eukprot:185131-Chlamydomonas_euryale.AAC.1
MAPRHDGAARAGGLEHVQRLLVDAVAVEQRVWAAQVQRRQQLEGFGCPPGHTCPGIWSEPCSSAGGADSRA